MKHALQARSFLQTRKTIHYLKTQETEWAFFRPPQNHQNNNMPINPNDIIKADDDLDNFVQDSKNGGLKVKGRNVGSSRRDRLTLAEMKARISMYWKDGESHEEICNKINNEFGLKDNIQIKPSTIHYHIKGMIKYWTEMGLLNVDQKMALVLARYDMYESIATEALFRSFKNKKTVYHEKQLERAKTRDREKWIREEIKQQREKLLAERDLNRGGENGKGRGPGRKLMPVTDIIHSLEGMQDGLDDIGEKIKTWKRKEGNAGDPRWLVILIDINDKRARLWKLYAKDESVGNADQELARLSDDARDARIAAVLTAALRRKSGDTGQLAPASPMGGFETKDIPDNKREEILGPTLAPKRPLQLNEEIIVEPVTVTTTRKKKAEPVVKQKRDFIDFWE